MTRDSSRNTSGPHQVIFESELRFITSNAAEWAGLETGGEFYGCWSHAARPVVFLATGPGPEATHESTHFAQDIEYFRRANKLLSESFGIQFLGDWHSHHFLGLNHPSDGDEDHIASIACRNDLPRMVEMILTCEGEMPDGSHTDAAELESEGPIEHSAVGTFLKDWRRQRKSERRASGRATAGNVCAHAFYYEDARNGQYQRCPIRVIPGMSPFRQALLRCDILQPSRMPTYAFPLPLDRVRLQAVSSTGSPGRTEVKVPTKLVEQILELPEIVKEGVETTIREGLVVVVLPVPDGDRIAIAFDSVPPHTPQAAQLIHNGEGEPIDLTEHAMERRRLGRLVDIYQRIVHLVMGMREESRQKTGEPSHVPEEETIGDRSQCDHRGYRAVDPGRIGE